MKDNSERLEYLLKQGLLYLEKADIKDMDNRVSIDKWSKKEILGHIIDSALNNLQRFTEIQFEAKPFPIYDYQPDLLVVANNYQNANLEELINCWVVLNLRIMNVISQQNTQTLNYEIIFENGQKNNLQFLINQYIDHLEHHLNQITKK